MAKLCVHWLVINMYYVIQESTSKEDKDKNSSEGASGTNTSQATSKPLSSSGVDSSILSKLFNGTSSTSGNSAAGASYGSDLNSNSHIMSQFTQQKPKTSWPVCLKACGRKATIRIRIPMEVLVGVFRPGKGWSANCPQLMAWTAAQTVRIWTPQPEPPIQALSPRRKIFSLPSCYPKSHQRKLWRWTHRQ